MTDKPKVTEADRRATEHPRFLHSHVGMRPHQDEGHVLVDLKDWQIAQRLLRAMQPEREAAAKFRKSHAALLKAINRLRTASISFESFMAAKNIKAAAQAEEEIGAAWVNCHEVALAASELEDAQ